MKGIIMAGGKGTRLHPVTLVVNKHLLPIYNKPMIFYPLSVLMLAGIREILIITNPQDQSSFDRLLGDGTRLGVRIQYAQQENPNGIPEAYMIGRDFVGDEASALILGDNIIYGQGLSSLLSRAAGRGTGATVFASQVSDPENYGVFEFDENDRPIRVLEKPDNPRSDWGIAGLYFFDSNVCDYAAQLKPSRRGELEIVGLIEAYMKRGDLCVEKLRRGFTWLDTGTPESLLEASQFIETIEKRQGLQIASLEEIALQMGFIDADQFQHTIASSQNPVYTAYLQRVLDEDLTN